MEFFVTMTTRVPDGTSEAHVQSIRSLETLRSRELAAQGHLLRLWRPPLQPGEWRTLGLFAAYDGAALDADLASMPLRVWRTDEVTALTPHPNDPADRGRAGSPPLEAGAVEFLTRWILVIPEGTPPGAVDVLAVREAERARQLAHQGHLRRLWGLPDEGRTLGLWRASDPAELHALLESLPMGAWLRTQTTPLTPHPNDPLVVGSGVGQSR